MNNLLMYCLSLNPNHYNLINKLGYLPVGLGNEDFSSGWIRDNSLNNISFKNPYYGEYTFHYWLWKNNKLDTNKWIGFCQYRKFWITQKTLRPIINFTDLNESLLKNIPDSLAKYECIIGDNFYVNQFRFSKFIKKNLKTMLLNPNLFFDKKKRTIKFHFDMMHGKGNIDKASELLPLSEKKNFIEFINTETSFNPHNMFICKNKKILISYYESLFPWLLECEKIFGFKDSNTYGLKRIYGFLAERYMSYWFKKYTKFAILPIQFKDLSDFN